MEVIFKLKNFKNNIITLKIKYNDAKLNKLFDIKKNKKVDYDFENISIILILYNLPSNYDFNNIFFFSFFGTDQCGKTTATKLATLLYNCFFKQSFLPCKKFSIADKLKKEVSIYYDIPLDKFYNQKDTFYKPEITYRSLLIKYAKEKRLKDESYFIRKVNKLPKGFVYINDDIRFENERIYLEENCNLFLIHLARASKIENSSYQQDLIKKESKHAMCFVIYN